MPSMEDLNGIDVSTIEITDLSVVQEDINIEDVTKIPLVKGDKGETGLSAYEVAVKDGFAGSEEAWLESLVGADGENGTNGLDGDDGVDGADGFSPTITTKTNTKEEYVLTITDVNGSFDTPNLKNGTTEVYDDTELRQSINNLSNEVDNKVDKVTGKVLSTNDFTNELKAKVDNIKSGSNVTKIKTSLTEEIARDTNFTVPAYVVGNNSLMVFYEGCKLIKDEEYVEVGTTGEQSTVIQFKEWDVPKKSTFEIVVAESYTAESLEGISQILDIINGEVVEGVNSE